MEVVPEGGSLFEFDMSLIADGHTTVEHSLPVANVYDDVLQFWRGSRTGYTPTLVVAFGGSFGENYWYQHTDVWKEPILSRWVPRRIIDARSRRRTMVPDDEQNSLSVAAIAKRIGDLGVPVSIGAHGQRPQVVPVEVAVRHAHRYATLRPHGRQGGRVVIGPQQ